MTGHINVMLVLQSSTDSLQVLPGSSSETFPTSSDCTYGVGSMKVEEEEVNVKREKVVDIKEEECIDIKEEYCIYSEEEKEEEEEEDIVTKEEDDIDIKEEVSFEDTV